LIFGLAPPYQSIHHTWTVVSAPAEAMRILSGDQCYIPHNTGMALIEEERATVGIPDLHSID